MPNQPEQALMTFEFKALYNPEFDPEDFSLIPYLLPLLSAPPIDPLLDDINRLGDEFEEVLDFIPPNSPATFPAGLIPPFTIDLTDPTDILDIDTTGYTPIDIGSPIGGPIGKLPFDPSILDVDIPGTDVPLNPLGPLRGGGKLPFGGGGRRLEESEDEDIQAFLNQAQTIGKAPAPDF